MFSLHLEIKVVNNKEATKKRYCREPVYVLEHTETHIYLVE